MTLLTLPVPGHDVVRAVPGPTDGPLLVVLSGMPTEPGGVPAYEGESLCRRLGVEGLLLRDPQLSWFVPELDRLALDLRARAAGRRLVLFGNSAGGYAALALGALADADEVVAVVPRSGLSHEVNDAAGDGRLRELRTPLLARAAGEPALQRFLDLPTLIRAESGRRSASTAGHADYRTRLRVLHASDNPQDAAHAARLVGLPETVVSTYPRGDHQLARVLRDAGELDAVVAAAVDGPVARHVAVAQTA